jgi:hydrogenase expression/formation protein HypC
MCLAVPGRVLSVDEDNLLRLAKVDFAGVVKSIALAYVPEAKVGDYVIVHVGVALSRLDEAEAMRTLDEIRQIAQLMDDGAD